ncbi:MAG TPA: hypothetical protein VN258_12655 [Mobilitalea sp.]|nr:hypothetical protein [Mobilitalea sp.]
MNLIMKCNRNGVMKRSLTTMLIFIMAFTLLTTNEVLGATSESLSKISRVSVHDPAIYYDLATGKYYVFGSHVAQASSTDLIN